MFYVYEHIRKDSGVPFYVGKGLKHRPRERSNRNKWWNNIVRKTDYSINILGLFENESDALKAERDFQVKYTKLGYRLCNLTVCGTQGATGYRHTPDALVKISKRSKELWNDSDYRNARHKEARGLNNPLSDKTIYSFFHSDYGEKHCTQFELRSEYNLGDSHLCGVISGKRFQHMGWRLLKDKNILNPKYDNKIYRWSHPHLGERDLRKIDLMNEFPMLHQANLCKVIKGIQNTHKGWGVVNLDVININLNELLEVPYQ